MLGLPQQQCWKDYPFAFDGGRKCCQYNSHTDESPLTIHSYTCKDDLYISCAKDECQDNGNNDCMPLVKRETADMIFVKNFTRPAFLGPKF